MNAPSAKARAVLAVVERIPAGSVTSYGDVAECARLGSARCAARGRPRGGDDGPWQRVVMSDGSCARHLAVEQLALLRGERTPLTSDGRHVDMTLARLT